jgi:hypothetical protein
MDIEVNFYLLHVVGFFQSFIVAVVVVLFYWIFEKGSDDDCPPNVFLSIITFQ